MYENASSKTAPLRLTPDITQPVVVLAISILLFAAGVELVRNGLPQAWLLVGLFALAILASLMTVLPGACFLEIDETGLRVVSRFRETQYQWSQIDRIGIFEIGIVRRIGIDLNNSYPGSERVPDYMKPASGYHVTLPLIAGLELENLVEILEKCLSATATPATSEPETPSPGTLPTPSEK